MSYRINWTLLGALTIACFLTSAPVAIAADDEAAMVRLLQSSQTPLEQKDQLCQKLWITGTPASVPALATLLTEENLSHSARLALQAMPCPEAGQALREALPKTDGKIRAGIIDSLGFRRDRQAVASIAGFLQDTDSIVASSAALALGRIGAPESAAALQAARRSAAPAVQVAIADGLLLCADAFLAAGDPRTATGIYQDIFTSEKSEHLRTAAYCGLIRSAGDNAAELIIKGLTGNDRASLMAALQGVRQPQGTGATTAIASTLPGLSTPVQLALIAALAQRGDTAAAPAIVALMQSPTPQVRLAAIKALDALGDASTAILLAQAAARTSGAEQELARQSLALIRDPKTRETLLAALPKAPAAVQNEIVRALGQRQEVLAVPDLLKMAAGKEPATRLLALKSLAMLADSGNLSDLIALLRAANTDAERDAAEQALIASCARSEHPQSCVPAILAATFFFVP
jgi:HEAT repeat protein